ncbi:MAG TPA: hypothetical protein VD767_04750 [Thermomicrobiales bacterium]|nr:hypothetical protein [Thermomicrobiales bacterium]
MDGSAGDLAVFAFVVALRLFVPLLIPKFPLPAVIACLIIDGVDQTIFQNYTDLELAGYQSYDKALDIYYLTIAYLSTFRNWENFNGFQMSRFLYYYRLAGVALFEIMQLRALLLFFPNTFEYFFIFYETIRLRWNPVRMSATVVVLAAGAIWVFIKVPQEYWIHIAQRDVTDTLRADPWLILVIAAAVVALLVTAWWALTYRLPPADRKLSFVVPDPFGHEEYRRANLVIRDRPLFNTALYERIVLIALVCFIFSQILPNMQLSTLQLVIGVSAMIILNTVVSEFLARRGMDWQSTFTEFIAMAVVNAGILGVYRLVVGSNDDVRWGNTVFFLFIISLLITLYDRYQPYFYLREEARLAARANPQPTAT